MIRPELEEAKKIAEEQEFQIIPISMELYSDLLTPIEVLRKLKNVSKHCTCWNPQRIIRIGADILFWDMTLSWN